MGLLEFIIMGIWPAAIAGIYLCLKYTPKGKGFFTLRRFTPPAIMVAGIVSTYLLFSYSMDSDKAEIEAMDQGAEQLRGEPATGKETE